MPAPDLAATIKSTTDRELETFSVDVRWLEQSDSLRLDASFYNGRLAETLAMLKSSGLTLTTLGEATERIYIPPRFKRVYVQRQHGVPFLQGSHVVHFQPADLKYLSLVAHERLERWLIKAGWVLVTCSGTIGRVTVAPGSWDGWAASQHILRIVPRPDGLSAGYISAFLRSELGQAQLTSRIYGAVVDEITEDQARSLLIPVPTTADEHKAVEAITVAAMQSVTAKEEAVRLSQASVLGLNALIPELEQLHLSPHNWPEAKNVEMDEILRPTSNQHSKT